MRPRWFGWGRFRALAVFQIANEKRNVLKKKFSIGAHFVYRAPIFVRTDLERGLCGGLLGQLLNANRNSGDPKGCIDVE